MAAIELIEKFKTTFNQLQCDNIQSIDAIYASDVVFRDPVREIKGLAFVADYFAELYRYVMSCEFNFKTTVIDQGQAMLVWDMCLKHKRLRGGLPIVVHGSSYLVFDQKIHRHEDYFDLGALLYENVPVLGRVVRKLKRSL